MSSRTAGGARRRCRTPRRGWTTPTGIVRTRRSRSASRSTRVNRSSPGRPRRGRCRRTSRSPSDPTSTTPSSNWTAADTSSPMRCGRTTRPNWARVRWSRCSRAATSSAGRYTPLFDYFADTEAHGTEQAFQVIAADFVTSKTAPASSTSRPDSARTTRSRATRPASRRSARWTSTAATPPRCATGSARTSSMRTPT